MIFYPVEQLREEFEVSASFYQIKVNNKSYQCRNHALIKRKGIDNHQPDAVIIMANPGSCSPKNTDIELPIMKQHPLNSHYVDVKIDPTQYQLMRLMKMMKWNMISIINLSDLCSGNMSDFKKKNLEVEQNKYYSHSIFSKDRIEELEKMLACFRKYCGFKTIKHG
ncbi:hypothetical protein [Bacillus massilinigeriensis]|uniref:hypothetical protein n=1 Tax=Bacillus massilionigeriensis TaxID=1805475 RepID=UPI00096AFA24|nr:hypothetical protein [Bacillus massilionigeriensis]